MDRITLLTLALSVCGCTYHPDNLPSIEPPVPRADVMVAMDTVKQDATGSWILQEFHDSISEHKAIGHYRMPVPVWTALLLRVDSLVVRCNGTLLSKTIVHARSGGDTILVMDEYGVQSFVYDAGPDVIRVMLAGDDGRQQRSMHYRRLRWDELSLIDGVDMKTTDTPFRFQTNYHSHLTQLLFTGCYEPLGIGQHAFSIDPLGRILGHPTWKEFWFHDYFGTLHPFEDDLDGLVFTDTTKQWPESLHPFNWNFSGDTLIMRSMTTDGDRYYLSKADVRFLKRPC